MMYGRTSVGSERPSLEATSPAEFARMFAPQESHGAFPFAHQIPPTMPASAVTTAPSSPRGLCRSSPSAASTQANTDDMDEEEKDLQRLSIKRARQEKVPIALQAKINVLGHSKGFVPASKDIEYRMEVKRLRSEEMMDCFRHSSRLGEIRLAVGLDKDLLVRAVELLPAAKQELLKKHGLEVGRLLLSEESLKDQDLASDILGAVQQVRAQAAARHSQATQEHAQATQHMMQAMSLMQDQQPQTWQGWFAGS